MIWKPVHIISTVFCATLKLCRFLSKYLYFYTVQASTDLSSFNNDPPLFVNTRYTVTAVCVHCVLHSFGETGFEVLSFSRDRDAILLAPNPYIEMCNVSQILKSAPPLHAPYLTSIFTLISSASSYSHAYQKLATDLAKHNRKS